MNIRPVRNRDADRLFDLIGRCYSEYDGVVVEPDGIDSDLQAYATALEQEGGEGYVLDDGPHIVALVSGVPRSETLYQLKRIYLDISLRGTGAGTKLLRLVENRARAVGAAELELWTDTRFSRAHRFYEREGFVRQEETRRLDDLSGSVEYHYLKKL